MKLPNPPPIYNPPTENLTTTAKGLEHEVFGDILEVQLQLATNNASTTTAGSSQNIGGSSSTQTNGGLPHQSPLWAPSPIQVIQGNTKPEQIQVEDWEDEAFEDNVAEEEELPRVLQEIEKQQLSVPKPEGITLTDKVQDSRSSSAPFRDKSLRSSNYITKTTPTIHPHLQHIFKSHTLNTHHQQCVKLILTLRHNTPPPTKKAHWMITYS
jgi:hypothetical protein